MLYAAAASHSQTHTLSPSSWEHFKWRCTWMAWRAAMATARPRHSQADRHFRLTQASPHWCCHGESVNSTPSSQKDGDISWSLEHLGRARLQFTPELIGGKHKISWSVVTFTICVSPGCNNNENRGTLSRSVVGVRLGRLIWAHSGPAQWTSSLCSTARLRSALPQGQPALLEPRGQVFPTVQLKAPFASL